MGKIEINGKTFVLDKKTGEYVRWITIKGRAIPIVMSREESAQWIGQQTDKIRGKPGEGDASAFSYLGSSEDEEHFKKTPKNEIPEPTNPYRTLEDALGEQPKPKGYRAGTTKEEIIEIAQQEFEIDASELYNAVDDNIANVINCELMRAKETFGVFPAIKTLKVFDGDDPKDWAEYDPADQSLSIRAVHPKSGEKMTALTWNNMIQKSWSDGGCSTNDWRHAFWHEIGHAYETYVKRNRPDAFDRRFAWIFDIWNTSKIRIYSRLSLLAAKDPRQLIAEAFCVVFSGDKTNELANEIVDMILTGGKNAHHHA